jgi:hypothetical protein
VFVHGVLLIERGDRVLSANASAPTVPRAACLNLVRWANTRRRSPPSDVPHGALALILMASGACPALKGLIFIAARLLPELAQRPCMNFIIGRHFTEYGTRLVWTPRLRLGIGASF